MQIFYEKIDKFTIICKKKEKQQKAYSAYSNELMRLLFYHIRIKVIKKREKEHVE